MCDCRYWWRPSLRPGRGVVWPSGLRQAGGGKSTPPPPTSTLPPSCCFSSTSTSFSCPLSLLTVWGERCLRRRDHIIITLADNQTLNPSITSGYTVYISMWTWDNSMLNKSNQCKNYRVKVLVGNIFIKCVTPRYEVIKDV